MKKIAILFGGCSPEYPVSLKSAYSILSAIDRNRYEVLAIGITRDGRWLRYTGDIEDIPDDRWHMQEEKCHPAFLCPDRSVHGFCEILGGQTRFIPIDGLFPVLHGKNGEDGSVQGLAELAGIPLVGCGCLSSALCMDKHRAHQVAAACGIEVPRSQVFRCMPTEEQLQEAGRALSFPLFVKPLRAGSSFGITKVHDPGQLRRAAENAFAYDRELLLEENIPGFEVGCAILGQDELTCGRVDEIQLTCDFFDFTEKYTQKNAQIFMPARIHADMETRIRDTAIRIFRALDCSGFARVDLFLTPDERIVFNEVNSIPGFTACSRYPNMLKGIGMSYNDIVNALIALTLKG